MLQFLKRPPNKYGYLPAKDPEATTWHATCVDLVGPCNVTLKNGKKIKLLAASMIDTDAQILELHRTSNKKSFTVAHKLDSVYLFLITVANF